MKEKEIAEKKVVSTLADEFILVEELISHCRHPVSEKQVISSSELSRDRVVEIIDYLVYRGLVSRLDNGEGLVLFWYGGILPLEVRE